MTLFLCGQYEMFILNNISYRPGKDTRFDITVVEIWKPISFLM